MAYGQLVHMFAGPWLTIGDAGSKHVVSSNSIAVSYWYIAYRYDA